jgi:hypothetical protein
MTLPTTKKGKRPQCPSMSLKRQNLRRRQYRREFARQIAQGHRMNLFSSMVYWGVLRHTLLP